MEQDSFQSKILGNICKGGRGLSTKHDKSKFLAKKKCVRETTQQNPKESALLKQPNKQQKKSKKSRTRIQATQDQKSRTYLDFPSFSSPASGFFTISLRTLLSKA